MRKIVLCFILLSLLSLMVTASQAQSMDATLHTLIHDDIERSYYLYMPETDVTQALIILHPFGSNGRSMQLVTGLNEIADAHGLAIIYPHAVDYYWDDGRVEAGVRPGDKRYDDVGFITSLAESIREQFDIEDVALAGFENGGGMALRVACETPEQFTHIIPVAVTLWEYHIEQCPDASSSATNLLMIMGADHPTYVPDGEDIEYLSTGEIFSWLGWQATVDFWRKRNQCAPSEQSVLDQDLTIYDDCAEDTSVAFWAIPKAGYNWPRIAHNTINQFGVDVSSVIATYLSDGDWESATEPEPALSLLARSWIVYVPTSYDPDSPAPLVLNLHGRLSNAAFQAWGSDFNTLAEREGVIVLYPNGINTEWNYLLGLFAAGPDAHSDEDFIRRLINDLDHDLNIDRNRMYVTGLSNGGFMTQRLACTMQDEFAAFVSVAATAPFGINRLCEEADPVPFMYIHGTQDSIVQWDGNIVENSAGQSFYISYPMQESFNFWGIHNGCGSETSSEVLPQVDPETQTEILTLVDCAEGSTAVIMIVHGGGHVWPGTRTLEYDLLGENTQDFNGTEVIWDFFNQYTLESDQ